MKRIRSRIRSIGIGFALVLLVAACGKDQNNPNGGSPAGQSPGDRGTSSGSIPGGSDTLTDINTILGASNRASLIGRRVELDQVKAHYVYYNIFMVGEQRDNRLPVGVAIKLAGHDDPHRHHVKAGDVLRIKGQIQSVPPYDSRSLFWKNVGPQGRAAIERAGIFINADSIEPSFGPSRPTPMSDVVTQPDLG